MNLFGQGVASMFKDVVPQASASERFGNNAIDWAQVRPFQVIKPMSSWAATNTGATAPTPTVAPTQTVTPQSEYQKWLAQQSGIKTGDGSRDVDRTSGPYGNGTNMSDRDWQTVKDMRDAAGGLSPYDKENMRAFGLMAGGIAAGSPAMVYKGIVEGQNTNRYLENFRNMTDMQNALLADQEALKALVAQQSTAQQQYNQTFADYLNSINVPTTSAQQPTSQDQMDAINAELAALASGSTSTGYQSAPAEPTATLSPSQTQAMVDSLTSAGYYTGSDGYNPAGDLSPTGYAADGMGPPSSAAGGGSESSGSSKIVCTAMNQAYGFGAYRNAVWLKYSADKMTKAHEKGYHTLFQPLVKYAYNGSGFGKTIVKKALENIARHRTADLRAEMRGTKRNVVGRTYRFFLEPLCYIVGKLKGY